MNIYVRKLVLTLYGNISQDKNEDSSLEEEKYILNHKKETDKIIEEVINLNVL